MSADQAEDKQVEVKVGMGDGDGVVCDDVRSTHQKDHTCDLANHINAVCLGYEACSTGTSPRSSSATLRPRAYLPTIGTRGGKRSGLA